MELWWSFGEEDKEAQWLWYVLKAREEVDTEQWMSTYMTKSLYAQNKVLMQGEVKDIFTIKLQYAEMVELDTTIDLSELFNEAYYHALSIYNKYHTINPSWGLLFLYYFIAAGKVYVYKYDIDIYLDLFSIPFIDAYISPSGYIKQDNLIIEEVSAMGYSIISAASIYATSLLHYITQLSKVVKNRCNLFLLPFALSTADLLPLENDLINLIVWHENTPIEEDTILRSIQKCKRGLSQWRKL